MIFDKTEHLIRYGALPHVNDVVQFLKRPGLLKLTQPEIEIRVRDLFVRVMRYVPKPAHENKFETHRMYADIQVLLQGREIMQYARSQDLQALTDYDAKNDYQFFKIEGNVSDLNVHAGESVVFLPGEAHRPSCLPPDYSGENLKLVFKVKMS